jgi:hypothetical protein
MSVLIFAAMSLAWTGVSSAAATGGSAHLAPPPEPFAIVAQSSNRFGGYGPTTMTIDIKPGDASNIVSASAGRVIPVAILGSSDLDITAINPRTIRLNGVDVMLVGKSDKSLCQAKDINGDGYQDLVCDVRTTGFKVDAGEYQIILKAATYSGESLSGEDRISIVRN